MEKNFALCATKKKKILTLVLSEKKDLNETKNHNPPLQVKWSAPYRLTRFLPDFITRNTAGVLLETGAAYPSWVPWFTYVFFGRVNDAHLFRFSCCVFYFVFVYVFVPCLVPNVASISGLPILDCPFGFL